MKDKKLNEGIIQGFGIGLGLAAFTALTAVVGWLLSAITGGTSKGSGDSSS